MPGYVYKEAQSINLKHKKWAFSRAQRLWYPIDDNDRDWEFALSSAFLKEHSEKDAIVMFCKNDTMPVKRKPVKKYDVFHCTWWIHNPAWVGNKEPKQGTKHYLKRNVTFATAKKLCKEWNEHNAPTPQGDKADFEEVLEQ